MKRRTFLQHSAIAGIGALALTRCKMNAQGYTDFGVQLWTLRDAMSKAPKETLKAIQAIGYTDVENAGYNEGLFYGMSVDDFKKLLGDTGLKMRSAHVPLGWNTPEASRTMSTNWEAVCEDHAKLGVQYVVCPWFQHDGTIDKYKRLAELSNKCGETAKKYGLQYAYHNHDFEFKNIDGQNGYDILLKETDKDKVDFELDLYWIKKGGGDALTYFKNYTHRFRLWHVKDMDAKDSYFTEVGNGTIDWKEIFDKKLESGMQFFYVEQDDCRTYSPLESIRISHEYMSTLKE